MPRDLRTFFPPSPSAVLVKCLNCGRIKQSFAYWAYLQGFTIDGFRKTCLTCAIRQILPYHEVYAHLHEGLSMVLKCTVRDQARKKTGFK